MWKPKTAFPTASSHTDTNGDCYGCADGDTRRRYYAHVDGHGHNWPQPNTHVDAYAAGGDTNADSDPATGHEDAYRHTPANGNSYTLGAFGDADG